jgi:hypothetical protein
MGSRAAARVTAVGVALYRLRLFRGVFVLCEHVCGSLQQQLESLHRIVAGPAGVS